MMTYLCLTKTNLFKAAVTVGAISNLDCENNSTYYKYLENINVNINYEPERGGQRRGPGGR